MAAKKKSVASAAEVKTWDVKLTYDELVHLRDLFSICLPPDLGETVSQNLAASENRSFVETKLWLKIGKACADSGVSLAENAPDFVVAPTAPPPMGIFRITQSDSDEEESDHVDILTELVELAKKEKSNEDIQSGSSSVPDSERKNKDNTMPSRRRSRKKNNKGK